jgi:salicylate hydroxylase
MHDGLRQAERDRQMLEYEPFEGFPNRWADPVFQQWLFGYDAHEEVEKAWQIYQSGKFPGTTGSFRASL